MKGGLFYDPQENRVLVPTDATFLEEDNIRDHQSCSKLVFSEISKETTDMSTRVVDQASPSTGVVDRTHPF